METYWGKDKVTQRLRAEVRRELQSLVFLAPLLGCNLAAQVSQVVMASDASERGGAVGIARSLTTAGRDFCEVSRFLDQAGAGDRAPILLISLFNGIGGAFRCYDIAGILPTARIAVEMDEGANRVTLRRWPGTELVKDVHLVTRQLVKEWSRKYLTVLEVHIWSGFPCTDLSKVKFGRENLQGKNSKLFYEIPRITKLVKEEFGSEVLVKEVVENVASMDESAAREISEWLGVTPYLLDPVSAVPMRRPRFCWSSESLEGIFPDVWIESKRYWREVLAEAAYPSMDQWVADGFTWKGGSTGSVLPTCLKSIARQSPPPRPAGLEKCDESTRNRWKEDQFRYPLINTNSNIYLQVNLLGDWLTQMKKSYFWDTVTDIQNWFGRHHESNKMQWDTAMQGTLIWGTVSVFTVLC